MATVDPRIAMGFAPTTQIEQPVNTLARLLQAQGLQQQNQIGQMKMDEYRSGVERKNKLAALLGGQYDTDEAREDALLRGGFMDEAQQARKSRLEALKAGADVGKTKADTEKVRLQTAIDKVGFIGQLLNGVNDPASYARARELAAVNGLDVTQIPEQYDPAQVEQSKARALSVQQQLEQMWKQKGYDLDVQKFGETKRSNRAGEALKARGQDLVNARSAEANAIMRDLNVQEKKLKIDELASDKATRDQAKEGAKVAADVQIAAIDRVLKHPGRATGTGFSGVADPRNYIPGTDATDFRVALDQVKGTAFLQAFQSLKGGGAITEMEGRKAEAAIARLDRAQSDAEFFNALNELRSVMVAGRNRMNGGKGGGASASFDQQSTGGAQVIDFGDLK